MYNTSLRIVKDSFEAEDIINTSSLNVSLTGSGDIKLDIQTDSVKSSIAGSGDITLKGHTNDLETNVTGSGDFHGFELDSKNTEVSIAGSGNAKVVSAENIKARVAGSGHIVYKGNPKKEDNKATGSGSISMN